MLGHQQRDLFVYEADVGHGMQQLVSPVDPQWLLTRGYSLCTEAIFGTLVPGDGDSGITPERFRDNGAFVQFLSQLISDNIYEVEGARREASQQSQGVVVLLDLRTPDPQGSVPPHDIVGLVKVENGELVPGSYQHNPNHRLFTADGFFMLPAELEAALQRSIRARCARTASPD